MLLHVKRLKTYKARRYVGMKDKSSALFGLRFNPISYLLQVSLNSISFEELEFISDQTDELMAGLSGVTATHAVILNKSHFINL